MFDVGPQELRLIISGLQEPIRDKRQAYSIFIWFNGFSYGLTIDHMVRGRLIENKPIKDIKLVGRNIQHFIWDDIRNESERNIKFIDFFISG